MYTATNPPLHATCNVSLVTLRFVFLGENIRHHVEVLQISTREEGDMDTRREGVGVLTVPSHFTQSHSLHCMLQRAGYKMISSKTEMANCTASCFIYLLVLQVCSVSC